MYLSKYYSWPFLKNIFSKYIVQFLTFALHLFFSSVLLDETFENHTWTNKKEVVLNDLEIPNLQRNHNQVVLTCKSANTLMSSPTFASVKILMRCKSIFSDGFGNYLKKVGFRIRHEKLVCKGYKKIFLKISTTFGKIILMLISDGSSTRNWIFRYTWNQPNTSNNIFFGKILVTRKSYSGYSTWSITNQCW